MNPTRILQYGLPLEKEASCNVSLELKIKGVNHGQEIAFSRAGHQDDLVTFLDKITEYAINSLANVFN